MILHISNLSFKYSDTNLLKNLDLQLDLSERLAIMGPNGSGKTSLLRILVGYYKQYTGDISYKGKNLKLYKPAQLVKEIAYIPQSVDPFPDTRVEQFFDKLHEDNTKLLIQVFKIEQLLKRRYKSLSGGEKQRVLLTSALARKPKLIIADELTQAVDQEYLSYFGELLSDYCQKNAAALLLVTHDKNWAEKYCQRVVNLQDGKF